MSSYLEYKHLKGRVHINLYKEYVCQVLAD